MYCSDVKRGETLELWYAGSVSPFYILFGAGAGYYTSAETTFDKDWMNCHLTDGKCIASIYIEASTESKTSVRVYASDEVQIKKGKL